MQSILEQVKKLDKKRLEKLREAFISDKLDLQNKKLKLLLEIKVKQDEITKDSNNITLKDEKQALVEGQDEKEPKIITKRKEIDLVEGFKADF